MNFDKNDGLFCMALGLRVQQERRILEQSTAYVAQKLCVPEQVLIDIEAGKEGKLNRDLVFSLADYYGIPEYELIMSSQARAATYRLAGAFEDVLSQDMPKKDLALFLSTFTAEAMSFGYLSGLRGAYRDVCDRLDMEPGDDEKGEVPDDELLYMLDHVCFDLKLEK